MIRIMIASLLMFLALPRGVQAQSDELRPYLYYYSRLLGGLIIERADGTDSRQIAADVIPPNMYGIAGPGWSPSGRYFAAYGYDSDGNRRYLGKPYLIDSEGNQKIFPFFHFFRASLLMQWSPADEDVLFVLTSLSGDSPYPGAMFWLLDMESGEVLADFGANLSDLSISMSEVMWDADNQEVVFYLGSETMTGFDYFRVTMRYDGTTIRERVEREEVTSMHEYVVGQFDARYNGNADSPSGTYQARGYSPTILTNTRTGEVVELPQHTQATYCGAYVWSEDEQYIIKLNGTLVAGGGCSKAVMGVTDSSAHLWRELGGCSWELPACAGWLPASVDIRSLPPGSPTPVQLDPVRIEYDEEEILYIINPEQTPTLRLRCGESGDAVYFLRVPSCPEVAYFALGDEGLVTVVAHNPIYNLLATYRDYQQYVSIWAQRGDFYEEVLRLNSYGIKLEFTEDGAYLQARNWTGWKVYAVADILAAIDAAS